MRIPGQIALLVLLASLSGCSGVQDAVVSTVRSALKRDGGAAGAALNPNYRYLRVIIDGRVVLMVLGEVDAAPGGAIEVWYSAQREVLRLQRGRVVGAVGAAVEWRGVRLPELPSWAELAKAEGPFRWTRARDVMPGYRFGLADALALRAIPAPRKSELQGVDPQGLTWFEEQLEPRQGAGGMPAPSGAGGVSGAFPPARYAVDIRGVGEVVYGEQCLAPEFCFTWQRWPVAADGMAGKR